MTETKPLTDIQQLSRYFGKLPGTTIKDFSEELKALSEDEKHALAEGIRNGNLTY